MFLQYFGLKEQPFGMTPDPRYLYQSAAHREALASLIYGVESGLGFTSLIAQPGLGKTTLLYYLLSRYRTRVRTAFIFETQCRSRDLLRQIFAEFDIRVPADDLPAARALFKEFLVAQARAGRPVLIVIDEAQNLGPRALEAVRLLSNFETSQAKLLSILLAGQPQLEQKLARADMLQLRQRIGMFTRLKPFTRDEISAYVNHRLAVAGHTGPPLFQPDAYDVIARETAGNPREINRVCFNALSLGCALDRKQLDAKLVEEVIADLRLQVPADTGSQNHEVHTTPAEGSGPNGEGSEPNGHKGSNRGPRSAAASAERPKPDLHLAVSIADRAERDVDSLVTSVASPSVRAPLPAGSAFSGGTAPLLAAPDLDAIARRLTRTLSHQLILEIASGTALARKSGSASAGPTQIRAGSPATATAQRSVPAERSATLDQCRPATETGTAPAAKQRPSPAASSAILQLRVENAAVKILVLGVLCPLLVFFLVYLLAQSAWLSQAITVNH